MPFPVVAVVLGGLAALGGGALVVAARRPATPGWPAIPTLPRDDRQIRYSAALRKLGLKPAPLVLIMAAAKPAAPLPVWMTPPRGAKDGAARFAKLVAVRPDADPAYRDGYGGRSWTLYRGTDGLYRTIQEFEALEEKAKADFAAGKITKIERVNVPRVDALSPETRDDYFRIVKGVSGGPLGSLLTAAGFVVPFIPGVGPAASAALAAAIALGQGKSLKDAAIAAARAAVPGGPLGQMAFDAGVGLASGQSVDAVAEQALLATLAEKSPEAAAAFQYGKALA